MIQIPPDDLALLRKILRVFLPEGRKVVAFGSRVTGERLKKHSDLDLCIMGDAPLTSREVSDLRDALDNSNLTMRIDIMDWHALPPFLKDVVEKDGIEFQFADN